MPRRKVAYLLAATAVLLVCLASIPAVSGRQCGTSNSQVDQDCLYRQINHDVGEMEDAVLPPAASAAGTPAPAGSAAGVFALLKDGTPDTKGSSQEDQPQQRQPQEGQSDEARNEQLGKTAVVDALAAADAPAGPSPGTGPNAALAGTTASDPDGGSEPASSAGSHDAASVGSELSDDLSIWLKVAGLTDRQLEHARAVCDEHGIESVIDLRNMLEYGTLDTGGFKGAAVLKIKKELGRAPADVDTVLPPGPLSGARQLQDGDDDRCAGKKLSYGDAMWLYVFICVLPGCAQMCFSAKKKNQAKAEAASDASIYQAEPRGDDAL